MKVNYNDIDYTPVKKYIDGTSFSAYKFFGCQKYDRHYTFRIFAPNAKNVYLMGDFNNWSHIRMTKKDEYGYFFAHVENAKNGDYYKYLIEDKNSNFFEKTDPFARMMDLRPDYASRIQESNYIFSDGEFLEKRTKNLDRPLNIYEIHLGSWLRFENFPNVLDIADRLIDYLKKMNYTHVEILPITEHPHDLSWGYQTTGYFAPSSRYGSVDDYKKFIDLLHQNDIGVILDFVPVHFATDHYGLINFDGSTLFESDYEDIRYSQWGSLNFDYSKKHVRSFIQSSIHYWLSEFHFDGIRMDAINNMIYWMGNKNRGVCFHNVEFLRNLNEKLNEYFPDVMLIAEDSSSYKYVTGDKKDSLLFDYKWDLGWMNDSLKYFKYDSFYRSNMIKNINFSMYYFYDEQFILPLSHDEVVHLKKSMINKMSGVYEDKFKQLKLLYTYQITHPGKKLNFMGNDLATFNEWNEMKSLDWNLLSYPIHDSYNRYVSELNAIYKKHPAFFQYDFSPCGFIWNVVDDSSNNIFSYFRKADDETFFIVLNMTAVFNPSYRFFFDRNLTLERVTSNLFEKYGGYRKDEQLILRTTDNHLDIEISEYEAIIFKVTYEEEDYE